MIYIETVKVKGKITVEKKYLPGIPAFQITGQAVFIQKGQFNIRVLQITQCPAEINRYPPQSAIGI